MDEFMKEPCKHCPFRFDITPFLTTPRAIELAYATENPYNEFPCHKTTVNDEEFGGDGSEMVIVETSKTCAGFLTMQIHNGKECPPGFVPSENIYESPFLMIINYHNKNEKR